MSGSSRIPYLHLEAMQYAVVGLPDGVQFKQPAMYSRPELRRVYNCLDKIEFLPLAQHTESSEAQSSSAPEIVVDASCSSDDR